LREASPELAARDVAFRPQRSRAARPHARRY